MVGGRGVGQVTSGYIISKVGYTSFHFEGASWKPPARKDTPRSCLRPYLSYTEAQSSLKAKKRNNGSWLHLQDHLTEASELPTGKTCWLTPYQCPPCARDAPVCRLPRQPWSALEPQPAGIASVPTVLWHHTFLASFPGSNTTRRYTMGFYYPSPHLDCKLCQGRSYLVHCQNLAGCLGHSQWVFLNRTLLRYYPHTLQFTLLKCTVEGVCF